jgi:hypothetical protein
MALVAALAASASFTAPVAVGPATSNPQLASPVSIQPDLRQGAWLQLTSPDGERLVRINEDGLVTAVELPLKLRGEGLQVTPLRDGWTVAVDRYWPGGLQEQLGCQPVGSGSSVSSLTLRPRARIAAATRCSELVVAQLSPSGRWTQVQSIPHSFGRESEASEPVETGNRIELAWSEGEQFQPIRVAVARPGHGFGRDHVAHSVLRREPNRVVTAVLHGALYLRGEYAPNPPFGTVRFWVDRQLYGNGTLGAPHVVRSGVLREPGRSLEGANGSELWLYGGVYQKLAFARRSLWAPTFGAPRVIVRESDGGEQFAQSQNHRTLISLETPVANGRSQIAAVEISPEGRLGALHGVELLPTDKEYGVGWASAINNSGSTLIATSSGQNAGQISLHPYSPRCPGHPARMLLTAASKDTPTVSAGRKGLFHVAWIDALNEVQSTTVRVGCVRNG